MDDKNFGLNILSLPYQPTQWVDADQRMFDACFAILGEFVENELGTEIWHEGSEYRGYRLHSCGGNDEKAIDLWLWYKEELPELEKAVTEDVNNQFIEDPAQLLGLSQNTDYTPKYEYNHVENLCDLKLRELIELRTCLWT